MTVFVFEPINLIVNSSVEACDNGLLPVDKHCRGRRTVSTLCRLTDCQVMTQRHCRCLVTSIHLGRLGLVLAVVNITGGQVKRVHVGLPVSLMGISSIGRAPVFGTVGSRFESWIPSQCCHSSVGRALD